MLIVPAPPKLNDLPKTVAYLGDHRAGVIVQAYLFMLASGLGVWFAGCMRTHLRRNEDGPSRLSDIAFGGALVGASMLGVCSVLLAASAFRADTVPNASSIRLMTDLGTIAFAMAGIPFAVFVGASAIASYRYEAFPRMHVGLSAVLALALASAPLLLLGDTGFFSVNDAFGGLAAILFGFLAWEAGTSVMLIIGEAADNEAEATIVTHERWHLHRVVGE
jgi:hypothetical protein